VEGGEGFAAAGEVTVQGTGERAIVGSSRAVLWRLLDAGSSLEEERSQEFQMRGAKQSFGGGQKLIRGII
jgi:hypothetical protein